MVAGGSVGAGARRQQDLWHIDLEDRLSGRPVAVRARALVSAAGPWVMSVGATIEGVATSRKLRMVRGSHIVVPRQWPQEHGYFLQTTDGRLMETFPYEGNFTFIGTTDEPWDEAVGVYGQILQAGTVEKDAELAIVETLVEAGRRDEARKHVDELLRGKWYVDDPDFSASLASALIELGDVPAARPLVEGALALNPEHPRALGSAAQLAVKENRVDQAAELLQRSVAADPTAHSISKTDASKLGEAQWSTFASRSPARRVRCSVTRFASPWWVTTTPFGRPVDPDV